jgi:hypothetical protein
MSTTGKIKFYKNPARNKPSNYSSYVPQYQIMGLEPIEVNKDGIKSTNIVLPKTPLPNDNPRAPRPLIQQPYAEAMPSPVGRGRGLLPNVGNNMEQTWSGADGDIVDDLSENDPNHPMIDNNEFVSAAALGLPEEVMEVQEEELSETQAQSSFLTENQLQEALDEDILSNVLPKLGEDEYLLLVKGSAVCSGDLDDVQKQTRDLVFGEHQLCDGNPMPIDDIIVLKRIKIKIGLFLE